ncbi:MAG: L,D-transpeptidase [Pseudomonadota bacterium]
MAGALAAETPRGPGADPFALTAEARQVLQWVQASADNQGRPFAIVDKKAARLFVHAPGGRLLGAAPALIGEATGDHTVPGVGDKPVSQVLPEERTTPAGRFVSEPGRNLSGERVVWVEYDSGFAIHRVRPGASYERRLQRLASSTATDNRASLGCVVVSGSFYDSVVAPVLGRQRAVVYVLPETRPLASLFGDTRVASGTPGAH